MYAIRRWPKRRYAAHDCITRTWILKKYVGRRRVDWGDSGYGQIEGYCEHCYEPSDFLKRVGFLDQPRSISLSRTALHGLVLAPAQCSTAKACPFGLSRFSVRLSRTAKQIVTGFDCRRRRAVTSPNFVDPSRSWCAKLANGREQCHVRFWQLSLHAVTLYRQSHRAQNTWNFSQRCRASRPTFTPAGVSV